MKNIIVEKMMINDVEKVVNLAKNIYGSATDFKEYFLLKLNCENYAIFCLKIESKLIGFVECSLRYDCVEGTNPSPVGYLEGVFVDKKSRNKGYDMVLEKACEKWVQKIGCKELASDCTIENNESIAFYKQIGFIEVNRAVCFSKKMDLN